MNNQTDRIQNAINHIKTSVDVDPWAVELAVEALEKELKNSTQEVKNSTDTISRQDAINELRKEFKRVPTTAIRAKNVIEGLSSAQPEQPEIIRCKDCENWDTTWQNDWAKNYHYCPLIDGTRNGNWYCADAERRTDE